MKSFAKLNLYLHVVGKQGRYHKIESLVVFLPDLYDEIQIKKSNRNKVVFAGRWKDGILLENNTVQCALNLINKVIPDQFIITVVKNIPQGSGLGGGSGNAACVLQYLIKKYHLNASEIANKAVKIGADVPAFMFGRASYISGIGKIVTPLSVSLPKMSVIIVYPNHHISSAEVYRMEGFKGAISSVAGPLNPLFALSLNKIIEFLHHTQNDLYPNSLKLFPKLQPLLSALQNAQGCLLARMTGSGSACFGIFTDIKMAKAGLASLQKKFPSYSIYISRVQ